MSNFKISLPQIAYNSGLITEFSGGGTTPQDGRRINDLFNGHRYQGWGRTNSLTGTYLVTVQFPHEHKVDHLILADIAQACNETTDTLEVDLLSSTNGSSFITRHSSGAINSSADTIGVLPYSADDGLRPDYIATFSEVSAKYWRVTYTSNTLATNFFHGKCYFGKFLDLGEPSEFSVSLEDSTAEDTMNDGTRYAQWARTPTFQYTIIWNNVTDAELVSPNVDFISDVLEHVGVRGCYGAFLYCETDNRLLGGEDIRHVQITSARLEKVYFNCNRVEIRCKEMRL